MPRNRMIKSEFWTSEQVISCSPMARLLFIGLWNFADDNGVHPASFVKIKAEVFPGDNIEINEIKKWIVELTQQDLLKEYVINEKTYWIVTGWKIHQKIDKPTYRYPTPQSDLKFIPLSLEPDSTSYRQMIFEDSTNTRQDLNDFSEKSGDEIEKKEKKNRKEKHIREVETSPEDVSKTTYSASKEEVFRYWQETMNHPRAKLDKKRSRVIHNALQLGYSIDELKQAIRGCAQTPFNMGQNDRQQIYDDISLILRDAEHIERFINNATNPPNEKQINNATNNLMSGVL
ncbi:TPA: hypothetical protein F8R87_01885 [Legionella pneumophila]|nr:hypothetical protein [Legionella pneumophila]